MKESITFSKENPSQRNLTLRNSFVPYQKIKLKQKEREENCRLPTTFRTKCKSVSLPYPRGQNNYPNGQQKFVPFETILKLFKAEPNPIPFDNENLIIHINEIL